MKNLLIIIPFLCSISAVAQTTDTIRVLKKHTIGAGGLPLHILFIDQGLENQSYNLSYKRRGEKINFRSSFNYYSAANYATNRSTTFEFIESSNDSTWNKRTTNDYHNNEFDIRFGLEKNFGKKRSVWLLGLDVVVGYVKSESHKNETYYPFEFGDTLDYTPHEQLEYYRTNTNFTEINSSHMLWGLSPAIGWEYPINNTFGLSIQYRPTITYRTGYSSNEKVREYFVDGEILNNPILTNNENAFLLDDIRFNGDGFDLFLTVNF